MSTAGRLRAAAAVEDRRGQLGLTQKDLGLDPTTYRDFIQGRSWPRPATRAKIEKALGWEPGEIARLGRDVRINGDTHWIAIVADLVERVDDLERQIGAVSGGTSSSPETARRAAG